MYIYIYICIYVYIYICIYIYEYKHVCWYIFVIFCWVSLVGHGTVVQARSAVWHAEPGSHFKFVKLCILGWIYSGYEVQNPFVKYYSKWSECFVSSLFVLILCEGVVFDVFVWCFGASYSRLGLCKISWCDPTQSIPGLPLSLGPGWDQGRDPGRPGPGPGCPWASTWGAWGSPRAAQFTQWNPADSNLVCKIMGWTQLWLKDQKTPKSKFQRFFNF